MLHIIENTEHLHFLTDYEMEEKDIIDMANTVLETPFFDINIRKQFGKTETPEAYFYKITPIEPKHLA